MALGYREIYLGCGQRQDGAWDVIVVPPGGGRDDVRVVQADLELLDGGEIAARLRERVRDFPQAEVYTADELLALCKRLRETMELRELP
jgi:hypothetical protein